jgi:hypothetical protein
MNMIILNRQLTDPPAVHLARLIHQSLEADGYFASQYPFPVFWNPHHVVLKPVFGMGSRGISGHSQIMPDLPPLRQPRADFVPGCHSSPGLKAWGFLA